VDITRTFTTKLTTEEELAVLRKYAFECPDIYEIIMTHPKGNCPFPNECKKFPCKTLACSANGCLNGHPVD